MVAKSITIEERCLLVVEGDDDKEFLECLLTHLGLDRVVQIYNAGGAANYSAAIKGLPSAPGFAESVVALGIVKDVHPHPSAAAAFQSIADTLAAAGFVRPNAPLSIAADHPSVGVLLVPPNSDSGSLEDLCLASVDEDPAYHCVEAYFACLSKGGLRGPENLPKAKVQAFLASRPVVNLHLGIAAKKGYLPAEHRAFQPACAFLRELAKAAGA